MDAARVKSRAHSVEVNGDKNHVSLEMNRVQVKREFY